MKDIADIFAQYGLWATLALVLLLNVDKIGKFLDRVLQRILPSYESRAKEREHTRQMEIRHTEQIQQERADTIVVFRDLMLEYRNRLEELQRENRLERTAHESRMIELIRGYEKSQVQVIEVMRDLSEVIRAQSSRLNGLTKRGQGE